MVLRWQQRRCQVSGRSRFSLLVFTDVIDRLVAELDGKHQPYNNILESFGFFKQFSVKLKASNKKYHTDLEEDFVAEVIQFREFNIGN